MLLNSDSPTGYHEVSYYCDRCRTYRKFAMKKQGHLKNLPRTANGLFTYSDLHYCSDGIPEVNNINVDQNFNVRTYEKLTLPTYVNHQQRNIPVPAPASNSRTVRISHLYPEIDIDLIIKYEDVDLTIIVGEKPHEITENIVSDNGSVMISGDFTYGEFNPYFNLWLELLVDLLHNNPPQTVGILGEILKYCFDMSGNEPTVFDKKFLRTIIESKKYICMIDKPVDLQHLKDLPVSDIDKETILSMTDQMEMEQNPTFLRLIANYGRDLIHTSYLLFILNRVGLVEIVRKS